MVGLLALGIPNISCSFVLAHFDLHSMIISGLDFLASNRSLEDPTGGGLVSANTHFDMHNSNPLSVLLPSPSFARDASLVRREDIKPMVATNFNMSLDLLLGIDANWIDDDFLLTIEFCLNP